MDDQSDMDSIIDILNEQKDQIQQNKMQSAAKGGFILQRPPLNKKPNLPPLIQRNNSAKKAFGSGIQYTDAKQ